MGRSADELRRCYAYIYEKHRALYERYGSDFARWRIYHMEMHSALVAGEKRRDSKMCLLYVARILRRSVSIGRASPDARLHTMINRAINPSKALYSDELRGTLKKGPLWRPTAQKWTDPLLEVG